jgi:predicted house-cleaning noncanonical NTP pyrophosphatase (MazG superfamily)
MIQWNKLVRDRIPEIIRNSGKEPITRTLSPDEYGLALFAKLGEEIAELRDADEAAFSEEVADVLEVIQAMCEYRGISMTDVDEVKRKKRDTRGAFAERTFLIATESTDAACGDVLDS